MSGRSAAGLFALLLFIAPRIAVAGNFVAKGSTWSYLDDGSDQGAGWSAPAFDDSAWATGPARLGYGGDGEATVVAYGPDANNKYVTTYFRRHFNVADPAAITSLTLSLLRDDGAVIYINGIEVRRDNLPAGSVTSSTLAESTVAGTAEITYFATSVAPPVLVAGDNVIAAEVHQQSGTSTDVGFDLELAFLESGESPAVVRGPYLQMGASTAVTVRWRTDVPTDSRVRVGPDPANLTLAFDSAQLTSEHEVRATGLTPATRYYYSIGSTSEPLGGGDSTTFFETPPAPGTRQPFRVWVTGDSGTGDLNAANVYDAYRTYTGSTYTDLWLMLGDNAYLDGTDAQYQTAVFDMYPQLLKQSALWPTLGNHDGFTADSSSESGPYYDIFSLPRQAEVGGVASGTEAYYSFDHGNVHFIVLDSYETDRTGGSPMLTWLEADLQATTADWIVAYWHHPPYSKGSHDSDIEIELVEMRQNVLPILENHGADLVLSGHSHSYERSRFIDGHYGHSSTFDESTHVVIPGSGRGDGTGAVYSKVEAGVGRQGAVYAVAGSSGSVAAGTGTLDHPAIFLSLAELGSMVLDVNGLTLDVKFLNSAGALSDYFTLNKSVDTTPDPFSFTDVSGVAPSSVQTSGAITIVGINDPAPISVSGGEYSIGAGGFVSGAGTVSNGETVRVRHTASALFDTATDTTLTIGGVPDTFRSTTRAADTTPEAFSFVDQGGVELGAVVTSAAVTVSGLEAAAAISVSGGEYSIDAGGFVSGAGTVGNGETVRVRHTATAQFGAATDTTLTIGGVSDIFTSTTRAGDATPDAFVFTDQGGVGRSAVVESNAITVAGTEVAAAISVSGGEYSIAGGAYTVAGGSVGPGQTVRVRHTAAGGFSATTDTTLTIGGVSDVFTSTTELQDTTPFAFNFTDQAGVEPLAEVISDSITVTGINDAAPISVSGGEYTIGAGGFVSGAGTVSNGQAVRVRHTASGGFSAPTDTTLTIGGVSDTFRSTTRAADTTPDAFSFVDQSGVEPGAVVTSAAVTIKGLEATAAVSVVGGEYSLGCTGSFTSGAGSIGNGQSVCVRHTASWSFSGVTNTVLTVDGVSDTFSSTTEALIPPRPADDGGSTSLLDLLLGLATVLAFRTRAQQGGVRSVSLGSLPWGAILCVLLASPRSALGHGDVHERIEQITQEMKHEPTGPALVRRARLYLDERHPAEARQDLTQALQLEPGRHEAFYYLAQAERMLKQRAEALRAIERFLAAAGNDATRVRGLVLKGEVLAEQGQPGAAADSYYRALQLSQQTSPDHYLKAADAYHAAGSDRSIAILDEGIARLGPLTALQERALAIELEAGRYARGLRRVEHMLAARPDTPHLLYRRAGILMQLRRPVEYRQALRSTLAALDNLPEGRKATRAMLELRESVSQALEGLPAE